MLLNFSLLVKMLMFCEPSKTQEAIINHFSFQYSISNIEDVFHFAKKNKLLIRGPVRLKRGRFMVDTYIKNIAFSEKAYFKRHIQCDNEQFKLKIVSILPE